VATGGLSTAMAPKSISWSFTIFLSVPEKSISFSQTLYFEFFADRIPHPSQSVTTLSDGLKPLRTWKGCQGEPSSFSAMITLFQFMGLPITRSEERRVGKECRSR